MSPQEIGTSSTQWLVPCKHPDFVSKNVYHDFSVLATGAPDTSPLLAHRARWLGGFTGRPKLLSDLLPSLRHKCTFVSMASGGQYKSALVAFWRFLDAYERHLRDLHVTFNRVERLHDITSLHLDMFSTPGPEGTWVAVKDSRAKNLRRTIREAISDQALPELLIYGNHEPTARRETPAHESGLELIRYLKVRVHSVLARWKRCDELAAEGRDLVEHFPDGLPRNASITEADVHATYRALIRRSGDPVPSVDVFMNVLGKADRHSPTCWPVHQTGHIRQGEKINIFDVASGLFPTSADVMAFFLLFLARSAWNPATVASINVAEWDAPYDDGHRWLFAPKFRAGGSLQWTVSSVSNATSCYRLVAALIERTVMLKHYTHSNPDAASLPDVVARSPWVGVTVRGCLNRVFVVDPYDTKSANNRLRKFIEDHNASTTISKHVPHMTSSEFRDLAAAAIYKDSQYSSWVTMLLLGHKNVLTFNRYGFRRASFVESFNLLASMVDDVFGQISVKRKFDITLTRAKLAGMKISDVDIARLENARRNRTLDGCGCSDPYAPPPQIDPGNRRDGCDICVQQHRCAASGCPNAFVFSDSLPGLSRRVAELEYIKTVVGTVRFENSSDAGDLLTLRRTLQQWNRREVDSAVGHWSRAISDGRHKVTFFAGQH